MMVPGIVNFGVNILHALRQESAFGTLKHWQTICGILGVAGFDLKR
jgi:hypothetical protein